MSRFARAPWLLGLAALAGLGLATPLGCSSDAPPPVNVNEAQFKQDQKAREEIAQKEYMPEAAKKPAAKKK